LSVAYRQKKLVKETMPKFNVTVLMAVYNGGEYLKHSIASVVNQSFRDFEFLIINDCSTDNTVEIIESFHDPRIVIHTNEKNLGQTKSLNVGLRLAKGDYVARIDADDVAFPQWLEQQVFAIEAHPDHTVISVHAVVIDENNRCQKLSQGPEDMGIIIMRSFLRSPINHVGSIMEKKKILEHGGYDERFKLAADYDLWINLEKNNCKITTTPQFLMAIRSHSESVSQLGRNSVAIVEVEEIMRKAIKHFSSIAFQDEEIHLLCKSVYDEGDLTKKEFDTAIEVLKKVYRNLVSSVNVQDKEVQEWVRCQCYVLYLKRIHHYILTKNGKELREISKQGIKEFGFISIFSVFFLLSNMGKFFISMVPRVYFQFHKGRARLKISQFRKYDGFPAILSQ